jgi:hypothetical protein
MAAEHYRMQNCMACMVWMHMAEVLLVFLLAFLVQVGQ